MTREEALQRIVDNNFAGEYGFDMQILIGCMVVAREMILNSQFPSEDCISRKEAIKAMEDKAKGLKNLDTINGLCGAVAILYDLPSIQPKTDVLDKIRAEIEQEYEYLSATRDETLEPGECLGLKMSLQIIDKYKAESEDKE